MNSSTSKESAAFNPVRLFRRTVALLVWAAIGMVVVQAALAVGSRIYGLVGSIVGVVFAVVAVAIIARRHSLRSWCRVLVAAALVAPAWIYLSMDEAELLPIPGQSQPTQPTDTQRASFETTLRFAVQNGRPIGAEFVSPTLDEPLPFNHPAKWADYLAKHGEQVRAARESNGAGRDWLRDMDAFDEIADLTPLRFDAVILPFRPWRESVSLEVMEAMRLAAEGRGNEAVDVIVPVIRVCRKLQANARTLVRFMGARVALARAMDGLGFILEQSPPDAAHRRALMDELAGGERGAAGIERAMWIEPSYFPVILELSPGPGWARFVPTLLHRRRTCNAMTRFTAQVAALAVRRDVDGIDALLQRQATARSILARFFTPGWLNQLAGLEEKSPPIAFRNPLGEILLPLAIPAYGGIVKNYWKVEDQRTDLLVRLRAE
ncbi:MAG: hypothetical protein K9M98_02500 [Cephaloticoccus sp.]|nr:hypothetical protein [Cephaloticoccus sp.]